MQICDEPELWNGGSQELELLLELSKTAYSQMEFEDHTVWLYAVKEHDRIRVELRRNCFQDTPPCNVDDVTHQLVEDLHEISAGASGERWRRFSLTIIGGEPPVVHYSWVEKTPAPIDDVSDSSLWWEL